jgi:hypothetical protein
MVNDARRDLHHAGGMYEKAIRRTALVTLRRVIRERFPAGPERRAWLRWAVRAANSQRQASPRACRTRKQH